MNDRGLDQDGLNAYRAEVGRLIAARDRYREALERIRDRCGDDAAPEENAVQIAREALHSASSRTQRTETP